MAETGLRERKKQQTRESIRNTALRLFAERGFESVTTAEIARDANVSQGTLFNYFPSKEDLFYGELEAFEEQLLRAVRERKAGESVLAAFRAFILTISGALSDEGSTEQTLMFARVVTESPALQQREQMILTRYTRSLAVLIAEETGAAEGDVVPWVAANSLIGVHRALIYSVRLQALAGADNPILSESIREQGERAFAALEHGLQGYAVKRA